MADRVVARGPGRVNLIGEHTDYNGGLALPFAIDRGVTVTASAAERFEVDARDLGETDAFDLDVRPADGWRAFVRGTVAELQRAGRAGRPARLVIEGDLEQGSGLSSSAALEAALCLALLAVAGEEEGDRRALAELCSRVEHDWVGARTGLLDQLAVLLARDGHALRLDFASGAADPVPLDLGDWTLATVDSGASHTHAGSGYNERRAECQAACEALGIETLRDAPRSWELPAPLDRRVRHVQTENDRVDAMVDALAGEDLETAGRLLDASHASLRDDYESSVPEVEDAVRRCKAAGATGARMVGGGFGGHVLALFPPGAPPPADALVVRPGPPAQLV